MKHDKAKSLGDRWANMERRQLMEEEAPVAKLKEQLKQREDSVKEKKAKLSEARSELDAAVEDFNEAPKRDPEDDADGGAQMAAPVTGPTLAESQQA